MAELRARSRSAPSSRSSSSRSRSPTRWPGGCGNASSNAKACCARRSTHPTSSGAASPATCTTAWSRTSPASRSRSAARRDAPTSRPSRPSSSTDPRPRCARASRRCVRCSSRSIPPNLDEEGLEVALTDLLARVNAQGHRGDARRHRAASSRCRPRSPGCSTASPRKRCATSWRTGRRRTVTMKGRDRSATRRCSTSPTTASASIPSRPRRTVKTGHFGLRGAHRTGSPTPAASCDVRVRARRRDAHPRGGAAHMIRVMIVDDHAVVRRGLEQLLGTADDIEVVGSASDGAEAIELAVELAPDVVLMDLSMPTSTASRRPAGSSAEVDGVDVDRAHLVRRATQGARRARRRRDRVHPEGRRRPTRCSGRSAPPTPAARRSIPKRRGCCSNRSGAGSPATRLSARESRGAATSWRPVWPTSRSPAGSASPSAPSRRTSPRCSSSSASRDRTQAALWAREHLPPSGAAVAPSTREARGPDGPLASPARRPGAGRWVHVR